MSLAVEQLIPNSRSQMDATIAYDSAAWLSPSDGHLVEGSSDCDKGAAQTVLSGVSTDPTAPEIAWNDQNGNRHEVWYSTASSLVAIMTQIQGTVRTLLKDSHYKLPTSFWYRGSECANFFGTANALQEFHKS